MAAGLRHLRVDSGQRPGHAAPVRGDVALCVSSSASGQDACYSSVGLLQLALAGAPDGFQIK